MGKNVVSDEEDEVEYEEDEREPVDGDAAGEPEDDEDEDDEDGQDEYEKDDFIVDDVEEEEEQDEEEERVESDEERHRKKKKKKKREAEDVLDEDDYELLRDNNAFHHRPKDSKKFKRLKKAQRDSDDDRFGLLDEEFDGSGKGGQTAEEKLKRSLFGDDEGVPLEDIAEDEEQAEEEEDGDLGEEDEMADFIVHEEEVDENGAPVRRKKMKRRKSRQAPGVSSSALQEAHEIFGDVDELLLLRKQGLESTEWREKRLEDEFEPIVLSEKYMTEKDEQIRATDIPERMQIEEESTGSPTLVSRSDEKEWIYKQLRDYAVALFGKRYEKSSKPEHDVPLPIDKEEIAQFLELHHVQKLDIPFIAMYRKEVCSSLLQEHVLDDEHQDKSDRNPMLKWHKVLWTIKDLDRKWLLLQKRKSALHLYYNKCFEEESRRIYDETRLNLNQQLFESIISSLHVAESEREIDDVDAKFNLHFPPGEVGVDEGQYKRPKRKSRYTICSKAGLWEVANKFGCSAELFGKQLSIEILGVDTTDAKEAPEDLASDFTCAMFETPQAVLKGARHMAAVEISCEPRVKKHVRNYVEDVVVSTTPTPEGNVAIDSFHQFASVKWLREKPIKMFEGAQWLLIQKAEEEKLLQVTIVLPETSLSKLVGELEEVYLSHGVSKSAQLWNEQRKLILQDALYNFLLPSLEKEARSYLTSRAKNWLHWEFGKGLWKRVSVGPYQRKDSDIASDDEAAPRVMACCWGPGKPATTFVMLDSSGEVLDVLYAGSLTLRSQNVNDQQRKKNDQQRVLKFMMDHQPHVVVLGAVNLSCTRLKEDIYEIIFKMVEENPRDVGHEMDELTIVYGDESLPRLYENSRISSDQLPGQSGIVKRAVALGRYLQNPLAMVATLCGPGREILSWKLNPLENFLTPDEKYSMIEQVMVNVTNQVGLDVNLAVSHEWLFAPLQFISGLGPRKAASLQRSLVRAGAIFTRKDFLTAHGLGKKVFVNAVGFLRVRRSGLAASSSQFIDLLDDTRIHPESYAYAQEIAKAVYEDHNGEANDDDDALEMAIEHVRDRPAHLKAFNLDLYIKTNNRENKRATLEDIIRELIQGFQDWRKQYKEPTQDEEFYMISGESEETLAEGRIVQATVRRVQGPKAICVLESGLTGMLSKEDYVDNWRDIPELADRLHEGDILTCKIKSVQMNRYQVFLVCKESEMRSNRWQQVPNLDEYYHEDKSSLQTEQEKARKEKELARKHFKPRMIVHPRFQNITADEAMEFLSDKEPGESIIRPSSRGPSYLTLTLKVYDGVYAHKDIVEGGKEHKDITSLLRIGKTLKIGEDTFEDLDEVMDRYVDPLVSHLKAMLNYRKFRRGNKAEVDELLRVERLEYPMRIVYAFGISHEYPGTFVLTYIRSTNPHHEYVGLYPKGFKFRKRMFEDIDRLVAYFQKHIDDPLHESAQSIRSVAAMVPMRSPATGGSSMASGWGGSSNEGGWRGQSFDKGRSSLPGSRTGRPDYSGNRDSHHGGVPRPSGGRGRGRGSYNSRVNSTSNERQDSGYDNRRETFSGGGGGGSGWGSGGGGGGGGGGWGSGGDTAGWGRGNGGRTESENSGWGNDSKRVSQAGWSESAGGGWGGGSGGNDPDTGNSTGWDSGSKRNSSVSQADNGWSGGRGGW
ncbi:hypothetical protein K2173_009941 [Erythroxylum novogranatense]|uniref:Transcription elongation factor spt6 n=1 Tax=Erythroxylum novogranatense TaxID=1862640 RepID=A0AAV8T0R3_9ROSI|nr:hypothetical protein K2173_009941 [Erythroxylum novogranatense]